MKVIADRAYNQQGIFRFNFWVKNQWVSVNVDERVPVKEWGWDWIPWATNPSKQGAWWMPLLEKAYAKLNQNYDRIIAGSVDEGLRSLTGMPVVAIYHQYTDYSSNQLLKIYKHFAKKNYPSTAGCCKGYGAYGLASGHAYSFLDIAELKDSYGNVAHTIVKMRNPWAKENYNGPWSDKDGRWTDEWASQVNLTKGDDGVFWMRFSDFITQFTSVGTAIYEDGDSSFIHEMHHLNAAQRSYSYSLRNPVS